MRAMATSSGSPPPDQVVSVARRTVVAGARRATLETRRRPHGPDPVVRATIIPAASSSLLDGPFLRDLVAPLVASHDRTRETVRIRSTAVTEDEAAGFLDAGFEVQRRLHLLVRETRPGDARTRPAPGDAHLRKVPNRRLDELLTVDHAAFEEDLRLEPADLENALRATPVVRVRRAVLRGQLVGYAIVGRADQRGYLQRLAVHPDLWGRGIGRALVVDGVRWCARRHVERLVVNTEHGNAAALHLYRSLGFVDAPLGLVILERMLGPMVGPTGADRRVGR